MTERPAINREVLRQVFIEAGHRCAVCGTPFPLERAHIIAWCKSKDNSAENLICLCANCHERADKDWDEATLRKYKERPWILRQNQSHLNQSMNTTTNVQITVDLELDQFDNTKQRWLKYALAAFLETIPESVKIKSIEDGSVKIIVELDRDDAIHLQDAFDSKDCLLQEMLAPLLVTNVESIEDINPLENINKRFDVFISHASEDKDMIVRALAESLRTMGLTVWYDEFTLSLGDRLLESIDAGISSSRYGIVVLSPNFLEKKWPQEELEGLFSRETKGEKLILPVWHNITIDQLMEYSPILASRIGISSDEGLKRVVEEILRVVKPSSLPVLRRSMLPQSAIRFDRITVPNHPKAGKETSRPARCPFDLECAHYFEFGPTNPILDVTVVNHSKTPVLIRSIGIEIVSVAQVWWIGAIIEPYTVEISAVAVIEMPDIWAMLEEKGINRNFKTLADVGKDIPPQEINLKLFGQLEDPIQLDANTPYRYILGLSSYLKKVPDYSIVKLWIDTNAGQFCSAPIYLNVPGNILHEVGREEFELSEMMAESDRLFREGNYPDAESKLKAAYDISQRVSGNDSRETARIAHNLGVTFFNQGKYKQAERFYRIALPAMKKHVGEKEFARCLQDLALACQRQGKHVEAQQISLQVSRLGLPEKEPTVTQEFMDELNEAEERENYEKAIEMNKILLKQAEEYYGGKHEITASMLNRLGSVLYRKGNTEEAGHYLKRALEVREALLGPNHPDLAQSLNNLAAVLRDGKHFDEAEQFYKRAMNILRSLGEKGRSNLATVMKFYAILLERTGRKDEARTMKLEAEKLE